MNRQKIGFLLLSIIGVIAIMGLLISSPIAQDNTYHNFIDVRSFFAIPNTWNVLSNLPFVVVGVLGLYKLKISQNLVLIKEVKWSYWFYFVGTILVGLGSSYYHWEPNNDTLVWDRLPMTIAIMALFSIIIAEFISVQKGKRLLMPLLLAGIVSIVYWYVSELNGVGDLRFYALIQFYPIVAIPIILICFNAKFTNEKAYWCLLIAYIIAKVFEYYDAEVFNALGLISGHSIKHIIAAFGMYVLLYYYEERVEVKD